MLSRLHRKTEALDAACLRALGHPNDYSIRDELLSALEWDTSIRPEHAHHMIRDLFEKVHNQCVELSNRLRLEIDNPESPPRRIAEIDSLRERLANLAQVLEARRRASHAG